MVDETLLHHGETMLQPTGWWKNLVMGIRHR